MNRPPLVDPRMASALLPEFWPQTVAIQVKGSVTRSPTGAETIGGWGDVTGLEAIPCLVSNKVDERKGPESTKQAYTHDISCAQLLLGVDLAMRAVVDDGEYDIIGIDHDPLLTRTTLRAIVVSF